jgi:hypothetical protein
MNNLICYKLNKKELQYALSPETNQKNIELFGTYSKSQEKFSKKLLERGLETIGSLSEDIVTGMQLVNEQVQVLKKKYTEIDKVKLDFDIAKIIHKNLKLQRVTTINYDFWRWLTLNYYIENVKWRWVDDPDNVNKIIPNAKAVFQRAFGERDRRIDLLRYWVIAERLHDNIKAYYYLEKISEKAKTSEGPFQDFINNIIDNNLFSPHDCVTKTMAEIMLIDSHYKTSQLINSFKRYHAFTNRFLIEADREIFQKEICKTL